MIVYLVRGIPAFVMFCVYGESLSSLLIESTDSMIPQPGTVPFTFCLYIPPPALSHLHSVSIYHSQHCPIYILSLYTTISTVPFTFCLYIPQPALSRLQSVSIYHHQHCPIFILSLYTTASTVPFTISLYNIPPPALPVYILSLYTTASTVLFTFCLYIPQRALSCLHSVSIYHSQRCPVYLPLSSLTFHPP